MNTPLDSTTDQDECSSAASFAHSLVVAPLDTANTIHNISLALNNGSDATQADVSMDLTTTSTDADALMKDVTDAVQSNMTATEQQQQQPAEARMAVAELLVSLAQNSRSNEASTSQDDGTAAATSAFVSAVTGNPQPITDMTQESPIFKNAVDYVGSVKKAYENNPKVYTEFLSALGEYHNQNLPLDRMVQTVMTLFQDQPDLLLGFKEFLPEAQEILNQLVPPMMYSDYKGNASKIEVSNVGSPATTRATIPAALIATPVMGVQQPAQNFSTNGRDGAAADFLSMIKELSQQEPNMYQHLITLLRKFQKDHNYANLYFYVSIILRNHSHLLQRFQNFLPSVVSGVEVTEPRIISKAPPEELVVSPEFIEAKDFVQTVKLEAKNDLSMYDRFIIALEKYQYNGWTLDQVYSEVSLIFWNHPDALIGFKQFISSVPAQSSQL